MFCVGKSNFVRLVALRLLFMTSPMYLSSCVDGQDPHVPYAGTLSIKVASGDRQFAAPGAWLAAALQVEVLHELSGEPVPEVMVEWRLVSGGGAIIETASSVTSENGGASTRLQLGSAVGEYTIEASFEGMRGEPARFTAFAGSGFSVTEVRPASARAGDTVLVVGEGFIGRTQDYVVFFDEVPSLVTAITPTALRVVVPRCMPTRSAQFTVRLGNMASNPVRVDVIGSGNPVEIRLTQGEVRSIDGDRARDCVRLSGGAGAQYLLIAHNASLNAGDLPFQLMALDGSPGNNAHTQRASSPASQVFQSSAEMTLRQHERERLPQLRRRPRSIQPAASFGGETHAAPSIGHRREFAVYQENRPAIYVTAEARAAGQHAVIYTDVTAPVDGLSDEQLAKLSRQFDDVIYSTDVALMGEPADLDRNGRIAILLSPAVNRLTPADAEGYLAGFAFRGDMYPEDEWVDSNYGEVIYAIVPDSAGIHGKKHSIDDVAAMLPGVLAHELAHIIHFNQRIFVAGAADFESDWLAEAIAHFAEENLARALVARGEATAAERVRRTNYKRAALFLANPSAISLNWRNGHDSLEGRGAGWLFLQHMTDRFGAGLVRELVETIDPGADNVINHTNERWEDLVRDWLVALYADDAPELAGIRVDPRYTFASIDLRKAISSVTRSGQYPLQLAAQGGDVVVNGVLVGSAGAFVVLKAEGSTHVVMTAGGRHTSSEVRPGFMLMRLK